MKVLFIGGTGIISSACSQLCADSGIDLYLLNRGLSFRKPPAGITQLTADIHDVNNVSSVLDEHTFDSIVNWIAFTPDHVKRDYALFHRRTSQYIFISSASAYRKPPAIFPVVETEPLENPVWEYSRNKIACEHYLNEQFAKTGFPITIVRPSHTYDKTLLPLHGSFTILDRIQKGKPVIVHGDGTSLWTMTHHRDFARAFVGLLANGDAVGETYHITSDEILTWDQITWTLAGALNTEPEIVHVTSDSIRSYDSDWGDSLLGDKAYNMAFDNSKIKSLVGGWSANIPFREGAREIVDWYLAEPDRQHISQKLNLLLDKIILDTVC